MKLGNLKFGQGDLSSSQPWAAGSESSLQTSCIAPEFCPGRSRNAEPGSSPQGWLSNFPSLLLRNLSTNTSCPRVGKVLPSKDGSCCWGSGWAEGKVGAAFLRVSLTTAGEARALAELYLPCVVTTQVTLPSTPWEGSVRTYYGTNEECEAPEAGACPSPTASRSQSQALNPFLSPRPFPSSSSRFPGLDLGKG